MLTDIFANRYSSVEIWSDFDESTRRLLVQSFRILSEQVVRYFSADGTESQAGKAFWTDIHDRLSMELGVKSLSPLAYSYVTTFQGKQNTVGGIWTIDKVCENWMFKKFDGATTADRYVKERLSLIEIGFRVRENEIAGHNANLQKVIDEARSPTALGRRPSLRVPGDPAAAIRAHNASINSQFRSAVDELNARFRQAGCDLNYHNGFIQRTTDPLINSQVETPLWAAVADPKWKNVDVDLKEAIDRRDNAGRDPALYAAKALESAIKIISDEKGLTHGGERGAHGYIDNLKKGAIISDWEADVLKGYFSKVRNPLGHGPGTQVMPTLTSPQTDWAIETSMIWIKSLVRRS